MGSESPEVVADPVAEQAAEPVAEQAAESAVEPNDDELIEIVADEPATATAGSASSIPKEPITDGTPATGSAGGEDAAKAKDAARDAAKAKPQEAAVEVDLATVVPLTPEAVRSTARLPVQLPVSVCTSK